MIRLTAEKYTWVGWNRTVQCFQQQKLYLVWFLWKGKADFRLLPLLVYFFILSFLFDEVCCQELKGCSRAYQTSPVVSEHSLADQSTPCLPPDSAEL
jgi:hypothetical protein